MKLTKVGFSVLGVFALFLIFTGMSYISYSNQEIELRSQMEAQQKVLGVSFDKTWKIISQQAQVTDKYKDSFKDVFVGVMRARYNSGGQLMKWVQESNPNFDSSLFTNLQNSIESQRETFNEAQKRAIDIQREHNNLLRKFPGSLFLSGRKEFDLKLVTSSRTEEAFKTGENDVNVFGK